MKNKSEYWYIEENVIEDFDNKELKTLDCFGPFESRKELENHLKRTWKDSFENAEHANLTEAEYEDFFSRIKIVKTESTIQPVAKVKIETKMVEIG